MKWIVLCIAIVGLAVLVMQFNSRREEEARFMPQSKNEIMLKPGERKEHLGFSIYLKSYIDQSFHNTNPQISAPDTVDVEFNFSISRDGDSADFKTGQNLYDPPLSQASWKGYTFKVIRWDRESQHILMQVMPDAKAVEQQAKRAHDQQRTILQHDFEFVQKQLSLRPEFKSIRPELDERRIFLHGEVATKDDQNLLYDLFGGMDSVAISINVSSTENQD